jgi:predicted nucleotidyltransferase
MNKLLLSDPSVSNEIGGVPQFYTQQILAALASEFVEQIVLFGSRAKGNYYDGSDIDICLFGKITIRQLRELEGKIDVLELPW